MVFKLPSSFHEKSKICSAWDRKNGWLGKVSLLPSWPSIFFCLECVTYCADWYVFTCADGCVPSQWEKSLRSAAPGPAIRFRCCQQFLMRKTRFYMLRCLRDRWLLVELWAQDWTTRWYDGAQCWENNSKLFISQFCEQSEFTAF